MIEDFEPMVRSAVTQVFDTMLSLKLVPQPAGVEVSGGDSQVVSSVGFSGAQLSGVVYICSGAGLARKITSNLLGLEEGEVDGSEMVNDAMGEMANMVVGQLKSQLCDRGMTCVLTVPSIVRGSNFTIQPVSNTTRQVLAFDCSGGQMLMVIALVRTATG